MAEIADAANISVKTLFTYIRSKEDLLFADTGLIDAVVASLRGRAKDVTPAQAVVQALVRISADKGPVLESLEGFQRGYGESEALRSRLSRLWVDYEIVIAEELARQANLKTPDADTRFEAAQLVVLVRATSWVEFYELAKNAGSDATAAIEAWLLAAAHRLDSGLESSRVHRTSQTTVA